MTEDEDDADLEEEPAAADAELLAPGLLILSFCFGGIVSEEVLTLETALVRVFAEAEGETSEPGLTVVFPLPMTTQPVSATAVATGASLRMFMFLRFIGQRVES